MSEKILVTSALPYANGPLHIGHIAGAYLPADIYVRYQRLKGRDVIHICATDEHGVPITITAEKEGITPQDVVTRYHANIKETFERFGVSFNHFSATSRPVHHATAQEFFLKLYEKGYVTEQEIQQMYCSHCDRFLPDRYIEGTCPVCKSEGARGDQCEQCGRWLSPEEIIDPKCKICGNTPQIRSSHHWFLRLDTFQDQLATWIDSKTEWKDNVRRFCAEWFKAGLKPRAITRDMKWGIPVPLEGAEGKVLYVWFDAPIGYISATKEWAEGIGTPDAWRGYWCDQDCKLVHFIGKDNIVFHAMVWPAVLMGHGEYVLPSEIPANEFLNLENEKISTSRNFAVWLHEALDVFPADYLRYYITAIAPENSDSNFAWDEFQHRVNGEFADIFGNLVNRSLTFIKRFADGKIPPLRHVRAEDQAILDEITTAKQKIEEAIEHFTFKRAQEAWIHLARLGNQYFQKSAPWVLQKTDPEACGTVLHTCALLIQNLAVLGAPFVPFTAERAWQTLGLQGSVHEQSWDAVGTFAFEAGHPIAEKWGVLVSKVDDKAIQAQKEKLGLLVSKHDAKGKANATEEEKPLVSIDEFARLEFRTGKVLEAEKVKKSKKLIKMRIDLGAEVRTIVAGIAQHYEPEALVGKLVVVVANLQPAKLMGIESQGMVLAAVQGEDLAIVTPEQDVGPGAKVR